MPEVEGEQAEGRDDGPGCGTPEQDAKQGHAAVVQEPDLAASRRVRQQGEKQGVIMPADVAVGQEAIVAGDREQAPITRPLKASMNRLSMPKIMPPAKVRKSILALFMT